MAKLLIFRGEAQLDSRELTEKTLRIGRGTQNDIVLEDPGKGVSRNHAEIRFEGGRYTLMDVQSQNGIWVSGERVPSVVLEPGLSAALGPFRLMIEAPPAAPISAMTPVSGIQPVTEMTQLSSRTAAPLQLDNLAPPVQKSSPAAPPSSPPAPVKPSTAKAPPPKASTEKTASKPLPKAPVKPGSSSSTRTLGVVAAAVVLIALSALIGYKLLHKSPPPVTETAIAPPTSVPVTSSVTTTIPASPTAEERLNAVEPIVLANVAADCQTSIETINDVLTADPNNDRAKALLAKATACANPPPARGNPPANTTPVDKPAIAVSPAQGGLEVLPGETEKAYRSRMNAMRKRYDDAVGILATQNYVVAMRALDEIVPDVPSGYLDLAARREEARSGIRGEAKGLFNKAQAAETRGDFDVAVEFYRRAHQLDQSLQVDDAIQRIIAAVKPKCEAATIDLSFDSRNQAALSTLQMAIKVLPPTDKCAAAAKEKLKK